MKNKIIIILSLAVAILLYLFLSKDTIVKTVTETKVVYTPETSKVTNTKPTTVKLVTINVPVDGVSDGAVEVIRDTIYIDKEVKEYTYIDTLSNGILKSVILSDHIYKRDIELTTLNKETTVTTTNTIVQNSLFLNFGVNKYVNNNVRDINISVDFTNKNKWRIGITGGYDFIIKDAFFGLKFGIPLN